PVRQPDEITIMDLRNIYAYHGLYEDAARMIAQQMQVLNKTTENRDWAGLTAQRANYLALSGKPEEAKRLVGPVERFWLEEARRDPSDAYPFRTLEMLYNSKAWGTNREKAYAAACSARKLESIGARTGLPDADYLYRLGQYDESWKIYQDCMRRGQLGDASNPGPRNAYRSMQYQPVTFASNRAIYQAGLAALRCGNKSDAEALLRRARWRDPNHPLAHEAGDMTHE